MKIDFGIKEIKINKTLEGNDYLGAAAKFSLSCPWSKSSFLVSEWTSSCMYKPALPISLKESDCVFLPRRSLLSANFGITSTSL